MTNESAQPDVKGKDLGVRRYMSGATASQKKLRDLGFDPIEALVNDYHAINKLIKIEEDVRDGKIVRLSSKGNVLTWYPDTLTRLVEQRTQVADKLLRYNYGRVPETVINEHNIVPPMRIQLTEDNESYHTSGENPDA